MSIAAMSCALALRGVTSSEKLLLLALANYADENMRCWPSQKRLAEDTCLSDRTIRTLMTELEAREMLSRTQRQRPDGSRSTDIITLHFAGKVEAQISGGAEVTSGGVGKPLPGGGEVTSALTTFEPSPNHQDEPSERASPAPTEKRRSRMCPSDWMPSAADLSVGDGEGLTPGEIERELAKFRDHEFRDPHSQWSATFRKWLRTAAERKPRHERPNRNEPTTGRAAFRGILAEMVAEERGFGAGDLARTG